MGCYIQERDIHYVWVIRIWKQMHALAQGPAAWRLGQPLGMSQVPGRLQSSILVTHWIKKTAAPTGRRFLMPDFRSLLHLPHNARDMGKGTGAELFQVRDQRVQLHRAGITLVKKFLRRDL